MERRVTNVSERGERSAARTWLLVVIGFDATDVGRLFGHENDHELTEAGLELGAGLWDRFGMLTTQLKSIAPTHRRRPLLREKLTLRKHLSDDGISTGIARLLQATVQKVVVLIHKPCGCGSGCGFGWMQCSLCVPVTEYVTSPA